MSETKRIKTALVSVYHKEGLDEIITKLHEEGVESCQPVEHVNLLSLWVIPVKQWKTLLHTLPFWVDV